MLTSTKLDFFQNNLQQWEMLILSVNHNIHLQSKWLSIYANYFQHGKQFVNIIYSSPSHKIQGALILASKKKRGTRFWNLRELIPLGAGPSDFFAIPSQSGKERDTAYVLANWFRRNPHQWDFLHLDLIPESSVGWREFVDALNDSGFSPQVTKERRFYKINTDASWDEYEKKFLHPKLADLRNRKNRMARAGIQPEVRLVEQGILNYLDAFLPLYRQRRETSSQPNIFETHPAMRSFLEAVIRDYEKRRWVRLSMLVCGETVMAYQLDWIHNGIWYHYMPAFDERFAEYSPGKMLLYETIKMSFANPNIHEFNFMRGESAYKTQFADQSEAFISIQVENPRSLRLKSTRLATKLAVARDRILK